MTRKVVQCYTDVQLWNLTTNLFNYNVFEWAQKPPKKTIVSEDSVAASTNAG